MSNNPLLTKSDKPFGAVPFNDIRDEHYLPALHESIDRAKANIEKIKNSPADFTNTIEGLETSSEWVENVSGVFFSLIHSHGNEAMQNMAPEFSKELSAFSNDLLLDPVLFEKVKTVYENPGDLNIEQKRLLENAYIDFTRNGALLDDNDKKQLRDLDEELSQLGPLVQENVLKGTNSFSHFVTDETELEGLPDDVKNALATAAEANDKKGQWMLTLQAPCVFPILKSCENRELRELVWRKFSSRAFKNEFDNCDSIKKMAELRLKRAQLLGYASHAEYNLEKRMANNPATVTDFLNRLLEKSKSAAEADLAEVAGLADTDGIETLKPWDFSFYSEKLKSLKYAFNDEDLKPYFEVSRVTEGVFAHANRLYGLNFKESTEVPAYQESVKVYEVTDEANEFVGLLYVDFFVRDTKRSGAWMTNFKEQGLQFGNVERPHVAIVCNFANPSPDNPTLLTFGEVQTVFHEFGHALHSLLSKCHYKSLSGTNVYWDFVELPSQIMENWTFEKESLDIYAKHYKTDELIPQELADKLKNSHRFQAGFNTLRQVNFASLDFAWHAITRWESNVDVDTYEERATRASTILPREPGSNISTAFTHIFGGGYSAGYYSYKWAEVLDADAFEYFKEKGIFNRDVAKLFYDNILSKGSSDHPMNLYKNFRGREPDPDALLKRDGLI